MKWLVLVSLFSFTDSNHANAGLAKRIYETTINAPQNLVATKAVSGLTVYELYGIEINDESTAYGRLACARVVSILLKKSGVSTGIVDRVAQIEKLVAPWKKVSSLKELLPGDVIIWRSFRGGDVCKGGGDCHVGVYIGNGLSYNNDWNLGYPVSAPANSIPGFEFKMGYRPLN